MSGSASISDLEAAPPYEEHIGNDTSLTGDPRSLLEDDASTPATERPLPPPPNAGSNGSSNNLLIRTRSGVRLEYNPPAPAASSTSSVTETPSSSSSEAPAGLSSLIGGSGVRIPWTPNERTQWDQRAKNRWKVKFVLAYMLNNARISFDPQELYTSATSQLDILLPLLSQNGVLPVQTTRRAVTLHLPHFPSPTSEWKNTASTHPATRYTVSRDAAELEKMFAGVQWHNSIRPPVSKTVAVAGLCDLLDTIILRIQMEGFVVCEEFWYPKSKLVQLILLC
ncbi:hypothetical protein SISSUDRAFT_1122829 [Sistotremastrum suecicum HHB10207 ss-3]|uniref:Uncharacterized protein n=1 Tax=Sistotremastrum suecicum HHB10207 ss-3 TaxID=1314776 RepID=A0A165YRG2_9AGAM|nr:hypothetical protein SISSUDRAFT_1122829 [Sistotremastrum suecicum HHB10207 ss-3]